MNERRKEQRCKFCGGKELKISDGTSDIMKVCLICGKDFKARREDDRREFKNTIQRWL